MSEFDDAVFEDTASLIRRSNDVLDGLLDIALDLTPRSRWDHLCIVSPAVSLEGNSRNRLMQRTVACSWPDPRT